MMMKTVIVDDEAPARRRMAKLLANRNEIEVVGEAESGAQAIEVINDTKPQLVLLDIELKDLTAFDVLSSLLHKQSEVIFITAYDQYAVKAFEEQAIDYILKPYKEPRFNEAIDRAIERIKDLSEDRVLTILGQLGALTSPGKVSIPEGKTTHLMETDNLIYIQADGYHSQFYFNSQKKKVVRISLKLLESILPKQFVRIGRSVMINTDKIESIRHKKRSVEVTLQEGHEFSTTHEIQLQGLGNQ